MINCCLVKPGELNRQITINSLTNTPDGQGGFSSSFGVFATVWAKITPMKGSEKVHSDRLSTQQLSKVMMRYISGLNQTMQVIYNSQEYQIRSIVNIDEKNEWLELMIEQKVAQ